MKLRALGGLMVVACTSSTPPRPLAGAGQQAPVAVVPSASSSAGSFTECPVLPADQRVPPLTIPGPRESLRAILTRSAASAVKAPTIDLGTIVLDRAVQSPAPLPDLAWLDLPADIDGLPRDVLPLWTAYDGAVAEIRRGAVGRASTACSSRCREFFDGQGDPAHMLPAPNPGCDPAGERRVEACCWVHENGSVMAYSLASQIQLSLASAGDGPGLLTRAWFSEQTVPEHPRARAILIDLYERSRGALGAGTRAHWYATYFLARAYRADRRDADAARMLTELSGLEPPPGANGAEIWQRLGDAETDDDRAIPAYSKAVEIARSGGRRDIVVGAAAALRWAMRDGARAHWSAAARASVALLDLCERGGDDTRDLVDDAGRLLGVAVDSLGDTAPPLDVPSIYLVRVAAEIGSRALDRFDVATVERAYAVIVTAAPGDAKAAARRADIAIVSGHAAEDPAGVARARVIALITSCVGPVASEPLVISLDLAPDAVRVRSIAPGSPTLQACLESRGPWFAQGGPRARALIDVRR